MDRHDAAERRDDEVMDGEGRTLRFTYENCHTYSIRLYEGCNTGHVIFLLYFWPFLMTDTLGEVMVLNESIPAPGCFTSV